jgi:hypothetical protein
MAVQEAVVKHEVHAVMFAAFGHAELPGLETEAVSEFQKKLLEVIQQDGFHLHWGWSPVAANRPFRRYDGQVGRSNMILLKNARNLQRNSSLSQSFVLWILCTSALSRFTRSRRKSPPSWATNLAPISSKLWFYRQTEDNGGPRRQSVT